MQPEVTATEEKPCKATAKFVVGDRLGVKVRCELLKMDHLGRHHLSMSKSIDPKNHRDPEYPNMVSIVYYWDGEYEG